MEHIGRLINDNERFIKPSLDNDSVNAKKVNHAKVDATADWLVEQLSAPSSREFFCKVAMYIPRPYLDGLVVKAKEKGRSPIRLFNFLAKRELEKRKGHERRRK